MKAFLESEVTRMIMATNPPQEIVDTEFTVIHRGVIKRYIGIGWVRERVAEKLDYEKYPQVVKRLSEGMETRIIQQLKPFKDILVKTCDRLLREGTPTTQFMRLLNIDIQFHAKIEVPSPDDFYSRSKNTEMIEVLKWLGFESTPFGICHKTIQTKN